MILLLVTFIAGILTVLAPCILPLLPVIVGGSLSGEKISKKRAIIVTASLGISVIAFTFLLKISSVFISVPDYVWRWFSGGIIFLFGIITIFPILWEKLSFTSFLNRKSNSVMSQGFQRQNFLGDVVVGASLGPVFATCSPTYFVVLATVLPEEPLIGFLYITSYTVGLTLTLLFIALIGQNILTKLNIVSDGRSLFKKVLGIVFIVVGLSIITGFDKKVETKILDLGFFDITKIEHKLLEINN